MKIINFFKLVLVVAFTTIFLAGCSSTPDIVVIDDSAVKNPDAPAEKNSHKIYLITMDLADDFWKSIDSGCRKAVAEFGDTDYKWIAPDVNEDLPQRICIERAVEDGAEAILLAASSPTGVNESLEKAAKAGVKIIFVDNAAEFDCVAFLATNNELAGRVAGETMKKALKEAGISSGKIGLTVNKSNVTSTRLRVEGFRKIFEDSDFELSETFFMEDDPQRVKNFVSEHPDYVAFFGSNERTALALGEQIKDSNSKQVVVGFDTSDAILNLLNDGALYATLQQKPQLMGYNGIQIALETLRGTYTEKNVSIDTGITVLYRNSI